MNRFSLPSLCSSARGALGVAAWALSALLVTAQTITTLDGLGRAAEKQAAPAAPGVPVASAAPVVPTESGRFAKGYLYMEPYQVRFECLIDLQTALDWLAVPDMEGPTLPADAAAMLCAKAAALADRWFSARIDSSMPDATLSLTQILLGEPGRTLPLTPGEPIPVAGAMLGFMWEVPAGARPETIQFTWRGFIENVEKLPVTAFFGAEAEPFALTERSPSGTWFNEDRLPPPKPLAAVPELPEQEYISVPLGAILWIGGGLVLYMGFRRVGRRIPGGSLPFLGAWLFGAVLSMRLLVLQVPAPGSETIPTISEPAEAEAVVSPLLHNIYRAFDHRHEGTIYDLLARSADGPFLKQLYLDVISSLTLPDSEAARVHVAEFAAEVLEVRPHASGEGFSARTSWSALGSVGHWGHTHMRTNVCEAEVVVRPLRGSWKITGITMLEHDRL